MKHKIDNEAKVSVGTCAFDGDAARKELTSMIVVHEYPLLIVVWEYFWRFVEAT